MIKEKHISIELAKLAKDCGFPQNSEYNHKNVVWYEGPLGNKLNSRNYDMVLTGLDYTFNVPTHDELKAWLREKLKIHIQMIWMTDGSWTFDISDPDFTPKLIDEWLEIEDKQDYFDTYEECLNEAALKILKFKKWKYTLKKETK